jgi:hypothetical protein
MSQISRLKDAEISNGNLINADDIDTEFNQLIAESNSQDTRLTDIESNAVTLAGVKTFSSNPKTNGIDERTAAAGVTIDSVRCKDGMVMVAGTPASGGEIGYASNRLTYHNGTSVITLPNGDGVQSVSVISANPNAGASDRGTFYVCSGTFTFGIAAASGLNAYWYIYIRNEGSGVVTIDPNAAETIDLATTMNVYPGETIMVIRIGSSTFRTMNRAKGWIPLATATASSSTSIDFTSFINSDFTNYKFELSNIVPATDATTLYCRLSTNAGSSWLSGASDYAWCFSHNDGGTSNVGNDAADSEIELNPSVSTLGTGTGENYNGEMILYNPANATVYKTIRMNAAIYSSVVPASGIIDVVGHYIGATTAINGVRFLMSSGNIASGTIRMYGWRQ